MEIITAKLHMTCNFHWGLPNAHHVKAAIAAPFPHAFWTTLVFKPSTNNHFTHPQLKSPHRLWTPLIVLKRLLSKSSQRMGISTS